MGPSQLASYSGRLTVGLDPTGLFQPWRFYGILSSLECTCWHVYTV